MKKLLTTIVSAIAIIAIAFIGYHNLGFEAQADKSKLRLLWEYAIDSNQSFINKSRSVKVTEKLLFLLHQGTLRAINTNTGKTVWLRKSNFLNFLVVDGGRLFVGNSSKKLLAFNSASGNQLWSVSTKENVTGISVINNTVFANQGQLSAHDIKSGKQLWITQLIPPIPSEISPYIELDGVIICNTLIDGLLPANMIYALDAKNGRVKWKVDGQVLSSEARLLYVAKRYEPHYLLGDFKFTLVKYNISDGKKLSENNFIIPPADPNLEAGKLPNAYDRPSGAGVFVFKNKLWIIVGGGYGSALERYSLTDVPPQREARYEGLGSNELKWIEYGADVLVARTASGEVFGLDSENPVFVLNSMGSKIQDIITVDDLIYCLYQNHILSVFNLKTKAIVFSERLEGLTEFDSMESINKFKNVLIIQFTKKIKAFEMN